MSEPAAPQQVNDASPAPPPVDPAQVRRVKAISLGRPMLSCRFHPGGRLLVAGGMNSQVTQCELAAQGESITFDKDATVKHLEGHKSWVRSLEVAPDGGRFFCGDYVGWIYGWPFPADVDKPLWALQAHDRWVRGIAVSPCGKLLATCGNDHAVRIWKTDNGAAVAEITAHDCPVYSVAFHPAGDRLVSADLRGIVKEWQIDTWKPLRELDAKGLFTERDNLRLGGVRSIAFNHDGTLLACGGASRFGSIGDGIGHSSVALFDFDRGERMFMLGAKEKHTSFVNGLAFHPAGFLIGSTGGFSRGQLLFWKLDEDKSFHQLSTKESGWSLDLHPDGLHLAVAHDGNYVGLYDMLSLPPGEDAAEPQS